MPAPPQRPSARPANETRSDEQTAPEAPEGGLAASVQSTAATPDRSSSDPRDSVGPSSGRRRVRVALVVISMVALVGLIAAIVFLLVGGPDVQALRANDPASTPLIDAHRLTGRGVSWTPVPYEEVSSELVLAVLVGEDIDFFSHNGFSASEIRVAIEEAVLEGKRLRGASTISQQVARYLWLSRERSAKRKVEEAWLTWRLERTLSKRRILELYLNLAEFSPGIFGVEAAAHHYFEKRAAELDADEAAALAASLPAAAWRPGSDRDGYRAHIERIRRRMDEAAWLRPLI